MSFQLIQIEIKRKTDFKKIKKLLENYKNLMPDSNNVNELSVHFAHSIKNELEREKIDAEVYSVHGNAEYDYLMATLKDNQKQQDVLIDPLFSNYIVQNNINIDPGLPFAQRKFLTSLYREGVSKVKSGDLEIYLQTIGVLSKESTLHR